MAALQRSAKSFRRQGSSGIVWDDKLLQIDPRELRACQSVNDTMTSMVEHGGSSTASSPVYLRSNSAPTAAIKKPSPLLGAFKKPPPSQKSKCRKNT
ncbi:MAPK kinase substrate protein At1g80180-like [Cornus florida]|uniref:MAPK kinase substrate protein At1g80180-like n=1 Tax=Cornus florida TaxID=4283 RepID=UPI002899F959|nr:MAPK kinase substrate protein At1g80180-like [Cornus florida]